MRNARPDSEQMCNILGVGYAFVSYRERARSRDEDARKEVIRRDIVGERSRRASRGARGAGGCGVNREEEESRR